MVRLDTRGRWIAISVAAVVALLAAGYWFAPHTLFYDVTVDETAPVVVDDEDGPEAGEPSQEGPRLLAEGEFVSQEHATTGTARLVAHPDGTHEVVLVGLDTSNGPDLRVWVSDQAVHPDEWFVFDDGYHAELGPLKGNKGTQRYTVPADVDLDRVTSVSVWCARFSVSFGAAPLSTSDPSDTMDG